MYNAKRTDAYFGEELNKFIQVAENHARKENPFSGAGHPLTRPANSYF